MSTKFNKTMAVIEYKDRPDKRIAKKTRQSKLNKKFKKKTVMMEYEDWLDRADAKEYLQWHMKSGSSTMTDIPLSRIILILS